MTERTEANFWPYQRRGIYVILAGITLSVVIGSIIALTGGEINANVTMIFLGSLIGSLIALRDGFKGPLNL